MLGMFLRHSVDMMLSRRGGEVGDWYVGWPRRIWRRNWTAKPT